MATEMEQWVIIPNNDLLFHLSSVTSSFDPFVENKNLFKTMERCIKHTMLNDSITFLLFVITTPRLTTLLLLSIDFWNHF